MPSSTPAKLSVLVLAYYYPPDNTSGVFRTLYFFNHIARRQHFDISILTLARESYRSDQSMDMRLNAQIDPGIKVYRARAIHFREAVISLKNRLGRKGISSESRESDSVVKSAEECRRAGLWSRCKDIFTEELLAFPDDKTGWLPFAFREARRIIKGKKINIIYSTGSPWSSHLLGFLLNKIYGIPLILDYRDPWYGNPYAADDRSSLYKKASFALEKKIIARAARVICNTERLREFYAETFGHPEKFLTIHNGFEPALAQGKKKKSPGGPFTLVHAGSLYGGRNPDNFVQAVVNLSRRGANTPPLRVILVGAGDETKKRIIEQYGREVYDRYFLVTPRLSHDQCLQYLLLADVLLLFQQGTALQVPRKLFEYVGLQKPVLAICDGGETEDIIQANTFGVSVRDEIEPIEDALLHMLHSGKLSGPTSTSQRFTNTRLSQKLEMIFSDCLDRGDV